MVQTHSSMCATYLNAFVPYFVVLCCHILEWVCTVLCCSLLPHTWMSLYCTLLFSAATYWNEFVLYNNKVWYKLIQVCGSREQQSMVQTHSSMWQQRTTKYSTNSFKYVAYRMLSDWLK
jgi:hypothetical protein